jgi:hypothetical protein
VGALRTSVVRGCSTAPLYTRDKKGDSAGWRAALLAEYLIGPHHKRHQVWRRYKASILAVEVVIADRTGP